MIKLKQLLEEKEKVLYKVNYKDGTSDYIEMTHKERTTMPYGNVKDVGGMKGRSLPNGEKLTSYEDMRKKAKKKIKEAFEFNEMPEMKWIKEKYGLGDILYSLYKIYEKRGLKTQAKVLGKMMKKLKISSGSFIPDINKAVNKHIKHDDAKGLDFILWDLRNKKNSDYENKIIMWGYRKVEAFSSMPI